MTLTTTNAQHKLGGGGVGHRERRLKGELAESMETYLYDTDAWIYACGDPRAVL